MLEVTGHLVNHSASESAHQQISVKLSDGNAVILGGFKSGLNNDNCEC